MKTFLILAALSLLAPSHASAKAKLNCGFPHPDPACHGTVSPAPAPSVTGSSVTINPSDTNSVMTAVLDLKTDLVNDLTNTLTRQASPINVLTGEAWDGPLVMCLGGTPALGTAGQPGYVMAQPGLIAWINGIQGPSATVSSVPELGADAGPAEILEHTHLQAVAGLQDLNNAVSPLVAQINSGGKFPAAITTPCAAFVQEIQLQIAAGANQITTYGSLLIAIIPKPLLMKHMEKLKAARG